MKVRPREFPGGIVVRNLTAAAWVPFLGWKLRFHRKPLHVVPKKKKKKKKREEGRKKERKERENKQARPRNPVVAQQVTNLTSIHKDVGLIPRLAQWVKDLA